MREGNIWVIPCGGEATQVTTNGGSEPAWSPDGSQIAFRSDRDGNEDIWVKPLSGGDAFHVTTDPARDGAPCWSPDGSQIAFSSDRSGGDIWIIPASGGEATQVTTDGGSWPTWSPDGSQIAFSRADDIWIIDAPVPVEPTTWGAIKASFR